MANTATLARIEVDSAWLLTIIDEINRSRSLNDNEVAIVERLVSVKSGRERKSFRWTIRKEQALLRMSGTHCGVKRFAERHGITEQAAWSRLKKLRKSPIASALVKG